MSGRVGLYEFLAVRVPAPTRLCGQPVEQTSLTHSSTETYDDDPEVGLMSIWLETTIDTRMDNETYDDDPGVDGLGDLSQLGTERTAQPNETYDDSESPRVW